MKFVEGKARKEEPGGDARRRNRSKAGTEKRKSRADARKERRAKRRRNARERSKPKAEEPGVKKSLKKLKKVLTNGKECDRILITLRNTKERKAAKDLEN